MARVSRQYARSADRRIDLLRNREVAGCELQERGGCRATVGNALKVVVAETRIEGWGTDLMELLKWNSGK
jgi:hypothetical protein